MAEKNRQEKRGKRAPFNLGARKHWINDSRERERDLPFNGFHGGDGVSLDTERYTGIPREGGRNKTGKETRQPGVGGTRHARKRVFNVFSSGAEPLGAHLDGG